MTALLPVMVLLAHVMAAALSARLYRRTEYRPVAWFLFWTVVVDVARWALKLLVLNQARASIGDAAPYTGLARLAFHTNQALYLSWPAGVAMVALLVFNGPIARRWVIGVYAAAVGLCAALYPELRGGVLLQVYGSWHYLAGSVAVVASILWWFLSKKRWKEQHTVALLLALCDLAAALSVYRPGVDDPVGCWPVAQLVYLVLMVLVSVVEVRAWTR